MDQFLVEKIKEDTPKINPMIANGLATEHMKYVENYINDVFIAAAADFPKGLVYEGCQRCTPQEEFDFVTSKKNNRRTFDIAKSDIYLMKYLFSYNGVRIQPRYIYLPYVSDAGFINLGGSRFVISPVLSDKVISLGTSNVFIRLLRDKLTFERTPHNVVIDGKRELIQVVWSLIYHKPANMIKTKATVKANCSLIHYLFCKYGFTQTFQKYGKCNPVVGLDDINKNNYPEEDWIIIESTTIKPRGNYDLPYQPTQIKLAIKRSEFTQSVKNMVAGFYYILDHFPQRFIPSYLDNTNLWRVLMGHIVFNGNIGEGKLLNDINEHFDSLDEYIDSIVSGKLKDIGYNCKDIYDLFSVVINNFSDWLFRAKDTINSMYDKELNILYFVLMPITSAIFKLHFKLKKAASKKILKESDIINHMSNNLKPGVIFGITSQHNGVSTVSYSGDNKFFEITSMLVPQKTSNRSGAQNDRAAINDPARRLHVSVAEIGAYLSFTKSDPSGRSQINPHVHLDEKSTIIRDPEKLELLDRTQALIKRD
jgi:hypothetical protein